MSRYTDFREVELGGEVYQVAINKITRRTALVRRKLPPAKDFDHAKGWRDLWRAGLQRPNALCAEVIQLSGHPDPFSPVSPAEQVGMEPSPSTAE